MEQINIRKNYLKYFEEKNDEKNSSFLLFLRPIDSKAEKLAQLLKT
jgi:hypothetical protein